MRTSMKIKMICALGLILVSSYSYGQEETAQESVYDEVELVLDNGNKWKVNEYMKEYLMEAFKIIDDVDLTVNIKGKRIAKKLLKLKDKSVEFCIMEGEGHHVLHRWLVPYVKLLNSLKQAEYVDDEILYFEELKRAVKEFNTYFE